MMFCADDDDASLKIPIVRPNDILDIEVSPIAQVTPPPWTRCLNCKSERTPARSKLKIKKAANNRSSHSLKKEQLSSPMKRGDPFLPSVFPDENPIADYTVKKNSRKKPSDCKCKGLGYNLSPSALLPEEMRQQWGVGMFGKPTLAKTNSSTVSCTSSTPMAIAPRTRESEPKRNQTSHAANEPGCSSSICCVLRCKNCMKEQCLCTELSAKYEGPRIPESGGKRDNKILIKENTFKAKENKSPGRVVLGSTNNASVIRRVACYNGKENANIISTSNFHRNNVSAVLLNGHNTGKRDCNRYKCGLSISQCGIGSGRCSGVNGNVGYSMKGYNNALREDIALTPRARHRQHSVLPRRLLTSISSSPVLSTSSRNGVSSSFKSKSHMSRSAAQMMMPDNQGCTCESCRRRACLMSRMQALGFSTSHAQQMLSPFLFSTSQRYPTATLQSSSSTPGRYAPYKIPTYGYMSTSANIDSPVRYQCPRPNYYDYNDSPCRERQPFNSTPLLTANEMNQIDSAFMDSESSLPSPPPSDLIEDITDLSIKDTVDFFVSMKSPFENNSPSPSSETSSGIYSTLSSSEPWQSLGYGNTSGTCYCSTGMCSSTSYSAPSQSSECSYSESSKYNVLGSSTNGSSQSMSLLYSSLVSDLEDELRCAIENIPTT